MSWLDQFDLSRRWAPRVPRPLIELLTALAMTALAVLPRLAIDKPFPDVVPYALVYPAVLLATLLAGLRAGLLTVGFSQLLVWWLVVSPASAADDAISLALTTLAELLVVLVVTAFRRASRHSAELEQARAETLSLALRELDHRTKNNFMLAAALLRIQASRAEDAKVRAELEDASNRLLTIESVQSNLAVSSADIEHVSLKAYLEDLCGRLRDGLFDDHVHLDYEVDDVSLPGDVVVPIGLIINELIANALKHAFSERGGRITVHAHAKENRLVLDIADDGCGKQPAQTHGGVGTRLVKMMILRLNATMEQIPGPGTRYRIELPIKGPHATR